MTTLSFTVLMWAMQRGYKRRQLYVTNKTATSTQINELNKNIFKSYNSVNLYYADSATVKILFAIQIIMND